MNFSKILSSHLLERGDKVFLKEERREYSFLDTARHIITAVKFFFKNNLRLGDRVLLILPNCAEFVFFYYASSLTGIISVPADTRYGVKEISEIIEDCSPKTIITLSEYKGKNYSQLIFKILKYKKNKPSVVFLDRSDIFSYLPEYLVDREKVISNIKKYKNVSVDEPFVIMYTSGSTGRPKGVLLNQRNLIKNSFAVNSRLKTTEKDNFLLIVPFSHAFGSSVLLNNAFLAGALIVIRDLFRAVETISLIADEKITLLYAVPTQVIQLCKERKKIKLKKTLLRAGYISGSFCSPELIVNLEKEFCCYGCIAYGTTESSCISISSADDHIDVRGYTVGNPVDGMSVKIIDDDNNEAPRETPGEIAIKGESLMNGYYGSKKIFSKWFPTGDSGYIRSDGKLCILGRTKELIIRGGFNIYPGEIERYLMNHDAIEMVSVFGIKDDIFGERIAACVILSLDHYLNGKNIIDYCRQSLASYKIPDYIIFADSFPMTASSKIKKDVLKSEVVKELISGRNQLTIFKNL